MRILSTIATKPLIIAVKKLTLLRQKILYAGFTVHTVAMAAIGALLIGIPAAGQDCSQGKGLTSNTIRWLAGSGDTLWMVTERGQELALSLIEGAGTLKKLTLDSTWKSFSLGCRKVGINDIFMGEGFTTASFDTAPNVIWTY